MQYPFIAETVVVFITITQCEAKKFIIHHAGPAFTTENHHDILCMQKDGL